MMWWRRKRPQPVPKPPSLQRRLVEEFEHALEERPEDWEVVRYTILDKKTKVEFWIDDGPKSFKVWQPEEIPIGDNGYSEREAYELGARGYNAFRKWKEKKFNRECKSLKLLVEERKPRPQLTPEDEAAYTLIEEQK